MSAEIPVKPKSTAELRDLIYNIDKVVSEETIQGFEAIAQEEERRRWEKGDLTLVIWASVQSSNKLNYSFLDVCYYVSVKFLKGQRNLNTVKLWALVARRFSPAVRARFHYLDLPFSHFVYAAKQRFDEEIPQTGTKWFEEILDYSWELSQQKGYCVSVRALKEKFELEPPAPAKTTVAANVLHNPTRDAFEFGPPIEISSLNIAGALDIKDEIRELVHKLSGLAFKIPAGNPARGAAYASLDSLKKALQALENPVSVLDNP